MDGRRHLDALAAAAHALTSAGVAWCVLRDVSGDDRHVAELDLLVDPAHAERAGTALAGAGFSRRPAWGRAPHRFFVAPGPGDPAWVKIDLVTELSYGLHHELRTDAAGAVLDRSRPEGVWRRLHPEDDFATRLLHALLDRTQVRPGDRAALEARIEEAGSGGPLGSTVDRRTPGTWDGLVRAVADRRWEDVEQARPVLRSALAQGDRRRVVKRAVANRGGRRLARPLAAARRPAPSVALLGPDGSGKSAVADAVVRASYGPVRVLYGGMHPRWARQVRAPGATTVVKVLRLWGVGLAAAWHRRRGRVVVFDRHPVEGRRPLARSMGRRASVRRRLMAGLVPAASAVVVLDAPVEVLRRRKQENPPEQLAEDRRSYLALAEELDDVTVLDATADVDDVARAISGLAWDRLVGIGR